MQNAQLLKKNISIIGLGRFGKKLAQALQTQDFEINGTTRDDLSRENLLKLGFNAEILNFPHLPSKKLLDAEIIVINIPPFSDILEWQKKWNWNKNAWVIFISSTSVYGQDDGTLTENDSPLPNTDNGRILLKQETFFKENFSKTTIVRFGGLIGDEHRPQNFLSGKKNLLSPLAPVNLVHIEDTVGFMIKIINDEITNDLFNLVSTEHRSRAEFYSERCRESNIPQPEFDMNDTSSGKIISEEKAHKIYQFKWPKKSL